VLGAAEVARQIVLELDVEQPVLSTPQ
jgi:hypothetical protein